MHVIAPTPSKPAVFPETARVLILDDERFDRHRLQRLSSGLPVTIQLETADNLAAFAALLEGGSFDLIFVDYKLPDGSGLDALEMIRMCPRNCTAATLMVTGLNHTKLTEQARAAGCRDVLAKDDLTPALFSRAVADALERVAPQLPEDGAFFSPEQVQDLLQHTAQSFALDLKPHVSRLLRQLRNLRDAPVDVRKDTFQSAEASCAGLWDYLVALERKEHSLPAAHPHPQTAERAAAPSRKPPSPFSRIN